MVASVGGTSIGWSPSGIVTTAGTSTVRSAAGGTIGWISSSSEVVTEAAMPPRSLRAALAAKPASATAGKLCAHPQLRGEPVRPALPKREAPPVRPAWSTSLRAWL